MLSKLTGWIPILFVFLWSTGFIGAKYGLPYAEPFTFLLIRMILVCVILLCLVLILKKRWPENFRKVLHISFSGMMVHAGYLGGVFSAIALGVPSGLVALIAGLQPLLTAFGASGFLGETVSLKQWGGLILGLLGVALVLSEKMDFSQGSQIFSGFESYALIFAFAAVIFITAHALYQKKYCSDMPLFSGTLIQYSASLVVFLILALNFETMEVNWTGEFIFALTWLIFVLSIGAIFLLMWMISQGEASKVASYFYMVPPVTAVQAYFLFGETLGVIALIGLAITSVGVYLSIKS